MREQRRETDHVTVLQETALSSLCERYNVQYHPEDYQQTFDLPAGWVAGWVGGAAVQQTHLTIYVGCSPEGEVHS